MRSLTSAVSILTDNTGDAPGNPLPGRLWLRGDTLFIYDGNNWVEIAGGGGGTPGAITIIGGDGINASTIGSTVTIVADIDTTKGLDFSNGQVIVKLGSGLRFDATGAIEVDPNFIGGTANDGKTTLKDADGNTIGFWSADQSTDKDVLLPDYALKSDIPAEVVPGDGTLDIKDAGNTSLGTFTANQAGDTDIVLPDYAVKGTSDIPTVNDGKLQFLNADGDVQYEFTANQAGDTQITLSDDGGVGSATDLSVINRGTETLDVDSSTGSEATIPAATTSLAGLMTAADKTKLDGVPDDIATPSDIGDGAINIDGGDGIEATGENATANQSTGTTRTLSVKTASGITIDGNGNVIIDPNYNLDGNVNLPTVGEADITLNDADGNAIGVFNVNESTDDTITLPDYALSSEIPVVGDAVLTLKEADGTEIPGQFTANQQVAGSITLPAYIKDAGVTQIVAGNGIAIDPAAGTGVVTINSTVEGLEFAGNVDVTDENTIPVVRSANQLYVNIGQGTFHPDWAAITNNATNTDEANPGDFMLLDTNTTDTDPWTWIEGGTPPSSDGTWIDDGAGNLYPATITNNVGIGTTSPQARLHVQGPTANSLIANFGANSGAPERALELNEFSAENANSTGFQFNAPGVSGTGAGAAISLATIGVDRLYVNKAGNVGIGTTSPSNNLHIDSKSGNTGLRIDSDGLYSTIMFVEKDIDKGCFFGAKNGGFRFSVGGDANGSGTQEKVTILPDGNVGIGTTSPESMLTIKGGSGAAQNSLHIYDHSSVSDTSFDYIATIRSYGVGTAEGATSGTKGGLYVQAGFNRGADIARFSAVGANYVDDPKVVIKDNGNVGIGTDNPAYKLHVNGDLYAVNYRIDQLQELV